MRCQAIVKDAKYKGKYVAMKSFKELRVVASGEQPKEVIEKAKSLGVKMPVVLFVPEKEMTHAY